MVEGECKQERRKNATSSTFAQFVSTLLETPIHPSTALAWIRRLGFFWDRIKKGIYVDGHDKPVNVAARELYLKEKEIEDKNTLHELPSAEEIKKFLSMPVAERPYVEIVQDEHVIPMLRKIISGLRKGEVSSQDQSPRGKDS